MERLTAKQAERLFFGLIRELENNAGWFASVEFAAIHRGPARVCVNFRLCNDRTNPQVPKYSKLVSIQVAR